MIRKLIPAAAAAAVIALPASASAATATASASCGSKQNFAGATYVIKVKTKGVACGGAYKVIKAHQSAGGGNRTAKGYRCKQTSKETSVTNVYATYTCKKGSKSVKFGAQRPT